MSLSPELAFGVVDDANGDGRVDLREVFANAIGGTDAGPTLTCR
jgi:hypothetical protein